MKAKRLTIPPKISRELREAAVFQGKGLQFVVPTSYTEVDLVDRHQLNSIMPIWEYCEGVRPLPSFSLSWTVSLDLLWQQQLIRNLSYSLEGVVFQAFKGCDDRFTPTSAVGGRFFKHSEGPHSLATSPVTIPHLKDINRYLETTLHAIPYKTGYLSLAATQAIRGVKDDHRFESWRQYLEPGMIFYPGEVGQVGDIRLIEVTHSGLLGSHQGGRSGFGEMLVFGQDPIMMLEERAPTLHISSGGHRKSRKSLDWKGLLAFLEVVSSLKGQGRIIYVTG